MRTLWGVCTTLQGIILWWDVLEESGQLVSKEELSIKSAAPVRCIANESLPSAGRQSALTGDNGESSWGSEKEKGPCQQSLESWMAFGLAERTGSASKEEHKH